MRDTKVFVIISMTLEERQQQQFWRLLQNRRGSDSRHEFRTETSSAQTMSPYVCYGMCALPDDVIAIACGSDGLRAVSLRSERLSPDVCARRKRVESGVRCAHGHTAAGSGGRRKNLWWDKKSYLLADVVASQREPMGRSPASTQRINEKSISAIWWCATRECCSEMLQMSNADSTRST